MIRTVINLSLLLMLPLLAFCLSGGAYHAHGSDAHIEKFTQMTAIDNPGKTPCHCKATTGLGCTASVSVGLSPSSSSFDRSTRNAFSSLVEIALTGNSQQVPLPPPKV